MRDFKVIHVYTIHASHEQPFLAICHVFLVKKIKRLEVRRIELPCL